jgi:hypothetical protein
VQERFSSLKIRHYQIKTSNTDAFDFFQQGCSDVTQEQCATWSAIHSHDNQIVPTPSASFRTASSAVRMSVL